MNLLTQYQKDLLKNRFADNLLSTKKMTQKEISEATGINVAVVGYYALKWGYGKKRRKKYTKKSVTPSSSFSLSRAIAICKENGLKVIRETLTKEEL